MSWLIGGFIICAVIGAGLLWYSGANYGRVKERNELLEKGIANEKARRKVEEDVTRMSDADVHDRLSEWRR